MSEVVSSAEFIRKKCRKDFEELSELFKFDKEFMRKRFNRIYKDLSELFKDEDTDIVFERFFKSFPTCMPSRNIIPFREVNKNE